MVTGLPFSMSWVGFENEDKAKDPVTLPKLPGLSSKTEGEIRTLGPPGNKDWYFSIPDRQWI